MAEPKATIVKSDAEKIKEDAKTLKNDTVEFIKKKAKDGKVEAQVMTSEIKDSISEKMEGLSEGSREQLIRMENKVRTKPLQAVATAFIAGAALSLLFGRR